MIFKLQSLDKEFSNNINNELLPKSNNIRQLCHVNVITTGNLENIFCLA